MNKKHIIAILALALCTALGIVAASALGRSSGESTSGGNDTVYVSSGDNTVSVSGGGFHVSFSLPDGWDYRAEKNGEGSFPVTIDLWPADHAEEPIKIICSTTFFSPFPTCVPRTDIELEWEEFHGQDWDVIYGNDFRYVTLLNGGSHSWWSEYHTEATRIINSMKITRDRLSEEQIVYEAVWNVGQPHAETRVSYDEDSAVWTVIVGDIFCVTLDDKGNIIDSGRICPEVFSFALTWNCYGISSYDSATGKLVKTTDATHPEDYVTTHYINEKEAGQVWQLIQKLDIESYPDEYDPNPGVFSTPDMTLILTVRTADGEKTVKAEGIAMSYESKDEKGQKFLDTCRAIEEILTDTEEWKALPDYEFLYE